MKGKQDSEVCTRVANVQLRVKVTRCTQSKYLSADSLELLLWGVKVALADTPEGTNVSEQLGLVQRLRNGGQSDLADDAELLLKSLQRVLNLLDSGAVQGAIQEANAAIDQAQGTPR